MKKPTCSVSVVRTLSASPETLYRAFTDPRLMRAWMAEEVEADVQVGGHYRIASSGADGKPPLGPFVGEYLSLIPGQRVLQSFHHVETPPGTLEDEFLELTFRSLWPGLTELTLTNGWVGPRMSQEESNAMRDAYSLWLDGLAAALKTF